MFELSLLVATVVCLFANAVIVVAKTQRADFVTRNVCAVGLTPRWIPFLAVAEGAGVLGVAIGLFWLPAVGLAGSLGLCVFFVGAVIAHVRAGVWSTIGFPALFLLLAGAAAAYFWSVTG